MSDSGRAGCNRERKGGDASGRQGRDWIGRETFSATTHTDAHLIRGHDRTWVPSVTSASEQPLDHAAGDVQGNPALTGHWWHQVRSQQRRSTNSDGPGSRSRAEPGCKPGSAGKNRFQQLQVFESC